MTSSAWASVLPKISELSPILADSAPDAGSSSPLLSQPLFQLESSVSADSATHNPKPNPVELSEIPATIPTTLPEELQGVGIEEHLNARLPLDLEFFDEDGKPVKLQQFFAGQRPVILTLVYYGCPMLCGLVLNAQMEAMRDLKDWTPGQQYEVVTISFDPRETPQLASLKKENLLKAFGKPEATTGWHFLTGRQEEIRRITAATGFHYRWDEHGQQFAHAPVIMIVTPDGRLSRYLHGVMFDPQVLRMSLVEASKGKIGTTLDHVFLFCFHYNVNKQGYSIAARNIMTAAGAITVIVVAAWLIPTWLRRSKRTNEMDAKRVDDYQGSK